MDNKRKRYIVSFENVLQNEKSSSHQVNKRSKRENEPATKSSRKNNQTNVNTPSDTESTYNNRPKKKNKGVKMCDETLTLKCCWSECDFTVSKYNLFVTHIFTHINIDNDDGYNCEWNECSYNSNNHNVIQRHISYHAYLTKLKCIGTNVKERLNLPDCSLTDTDIIPDCNVPYLCDWDRCGLLFNRIQTFFNHVQCHVKGEPKIIKKGNKDTYGCCWIGCPVTCSKVYFLNEHVRSHTHEKLVACPKCGKMFACKTKFHDHCKRQEKVNDDGYQCSQCLKIFPSVRLLRNHVRIHVNNYKCHFCDMTCTTPAQISRHIRYRHLDERPFKCNICNHADVTKGDLQYHMKTHAMECLYKCEECSFECRSKIGLKRHVDTDHRGYTIQDRCVYACHCCPKKYTRGSFLTEHLLSLHDFQWPSGHSRFSYKQDPEDGLFRLQTIRYESIEVTQEMIEGQSQPTSNTQPQYKLHEKKDLNDHSYMVVMSDTNEDSESGFDNTILQVDNNVVITIDEVDADGNIIKSEVMNSKNIAVTLNQSMKNVL